MATLRCPRCDLLIEAADKPPLRCERCRTPLRRCRQCKYLDSKQRACVHPEVIDYYERVIDPDEPRLCDYFVFSPPKTARPPRILWGVTSYAWETIVVVLVIFALLYIGLSRYNKVGPMQTVLQYRVQAMGTVSVDEPFDVSFAVYNRGKNSAHNVTLLLGGRTLENMELLAVEPNAIQEEGRVGSISLKFGEIKSGESLLGRMTFKPKKVGRYSIYTTLSSTNTPGPQSDRQRVRVTY